MPENAIAPSLELDQDQPAQRREWRFERAGWVAILALVAAALAGLFGDGPLSQVSAGSASGGLSVGYERIVRSGRTSTLSVIAGASSGADSIAVIGLDRRYVESMAVVRITPEPVESRATRDRLVYHIRRGVPGGPARVDFFISPSGFGRRRLSVETAAGSLELRQFVLP
ncbi:MAG: hypothetical protein JWL60_796 [Gemmatimonadetes bacterium]|jgi:hypothetical protein|nr:hypothetical protein [Gemmatimonadota bacterium]